MKQYLASLHFYFARGGGAVQLAGSVIENPHGLHWNTFRSAANANHVASFIICPQIGQVTSMGVASVRIFNALEGSALTHVKGTAPCYTSSKPTISTRPSWSLITRTR